MKPQELQGRLAEFARDVGRFVRPLYERMATRDVARQLARAAASAAANHRAAGRARSHAEFTSKISVALEEGDEAVFWLEHLDGLKIAGLQSPELLMREARELAAILGASVRTARRRRTR